jgi:hypothetical protein
VFIAKSRKLICCADKQYIFNINMMISKKKKYHPFHWITRYPKTLKLHFLTLSSEKKHSLFTDCSNSPYGGGHCLRTSNSSRFGVEGPNDFHAATWTQTPPHDLNPKYQEEFDWILGPFFPENSWAQGVTLVSLLSCK